MRTLLHACFRHVLSLIGVVITTVSALLFVALYLLHIFGLTPNPYLGLIAFGALPLLLVIGLTLVTLGLWLDRRKRRRAIAAGSPMTDFPVLDFNNPRTRILALTVAGLTLVNVFVISMGTYEGAQTMTTSAFCGATCHSVMTPEYVAYQRSPHSQVRCTDCHVGPGAQHFVESKWRGAWQVISVNLNLYPRPIQRVNWLPPPESCYRCHRPERNIGERLRVYRSFADDEKQTPKNTVLMLRIGGMVKGKWEGIHWHNDPKAKLRYLSDPEHKMIKTVEVTRPDGTVRSYTSPEVKIPEGQAEWHTMDCNGCHNRPAHLFRTPEQEIDSSLVKGDIDRSLPFVRREGVRLLQGQYATQEAARTQIAQGLQAFYQASYPKLATEKATEIAAAGQELGNAYSSNVFPYMNIVWGTYPDFRRHEQGCWRCHDNEHVSTDGHKISKACGGACHEVIATEEEDPEVLQILYP